MRTSLELGEGSWFCLQRLRSKEGVGQEGMSGSYGGNMDWARGLGFACSSCAARRELAGERVWQLQRQHLNVGMVRQQGRGGGPRSAGVLLTQQGKEAGRGARCGKRPWLCLQRLGRQEGARRESDGRLLGSVKRWDAGVSPSQAL